MTRISLSVGGKKSGSHTTEVQHKTRQTAVNKVTKPEANLRLVKIWQHIAMIDRLIAGLMTDTDIGTDTDTDTDTDTAQAAATSNEIIK